MDRALVATETGGRGNRLERCKVTLVSRIAGVALGLLVAVATLTGAQAAAPTRADFARVPAIQSVSLSPDGKHLVALTSPDGKQIYISVWRTDALDRTPTVINASKMRFLGVEFIKNDHLQVTAMQTFTVGDDRRHLFKTYITDLEGKRWRPLLPETRGASELEDFWNKFADANIIDDLPLDPKHVLVVDNRLKTYGDIYRVDVETGVADRIDHASDRFFDKQTDLKGDIRARQEFDYENGNAYIAQWLKHPDTNAWEEHFRWFAKDRVPVDVVGFTPDPDIIYIATVAPGEDRRAIYAYDVRARKILEPVFKHKLFETIGIKPSKRKEDFGEPIGFVFEAEKPRTYWIDEGIVALDKGLRTAMGVKTATTQWTDPATGQTASIPVVEDADIDILQVSGDRKTALVVKSGPRQPPEYYLYKDGKLSLLGRSGSHIDAATLGDSRLVQYPARDGLMIPAFLTTPPKNIYGNGPYPTLIEPHGGPWSRDYLGWDDSGWVQYFASRGYAVLQPQFRGSEGWGQKLWRAGDAEWGQKMQDDKDDGAKWLIAQKIAAPDRIAMFGYSYGGYAALAAAIRPNGLYQCAIAGAGAGDLAKFNRQTFDNRYLREFQNPTIKGLDAMKRADEASIPVFLYHGDRDSVVDVEDSRRFAARLKSAGRPYKLLEIKDMGHWFVTMTPEMLEQQLVEVEAYLKNDCGPGGL